MNQRERVMGAIVGDIVGSIYEFNNYRAKDFPLFSDSCFPTDDSIMTIAVAKALDESAGDWTSLSDHAVKCMKKLGRPYPDCGFGGRFYGWIYSDDTEPYNSCGNGAAMRVSPVAYVAESEDEVKLLSELVTAVTHNHPEGIKGAEATAVATWMALNGATKDEIIEKMQGYYDLDFTVDGIRDTFEFNETCQMTVPQAIVCFRDAVDFEDTIRNAISIGGDCDTVAAIAGAIAGAYYGIPDEIYEKAWSYLDTRLASAIAKFIH